MRCIRTSIVAAMAVAMFASMAVAQSDVVPRMAISVVGGAGSTSGATGVALGGSWLLDLNDRASLEAQGTYLGRGAGTDAVSVAVSLLVNLLPARGRIVPYAAVGGGMYRASFDLANPALFGPIGAQLRPGSVVCPAPGRGFEPVHGTGFGPGTGTCPATVDGDWGVGHMPRFYARRLGPIGVPVGGVWETRSFRDPAMSVGGGLRFNVNEYLTVRPDVRALIVFADGATHAIGVFGVHLGYRF